MTDRPSTAPVVKRTADPAEPRGPEQVIGPSLVFVPIERPPGGSVDLGDRENGASFRLGMGSGSSPFTSGRASMSIRHGGDDPIEVIRAMQDEGVEQISGAGRPSLPSIVGGDAKYTRPL